MVRNRVMIRNRGDSISRANRLMRKSKMGLIILIYILVLGSESLKVLMSKSLKVLKSEGLLVWKSEGS